MFKKFKFKNWTSWLIALVMVLSLVTPFNVSAAEKTVDLQILATSDTHGKFVPYEYAINSESKSGSMTQIATAVKELKKANPNTILVDAGDTIQDNSASLFLDNEIHPMILAMNEIGYDTWTLGNHEFNYGVPTLEKVASQFKGTMLCGNVYKKDGERLGKPYNIVEKAGVKIGIIGMTTPNITRWDSENLKGYRVTDSVEETKKVISEIKDKVDVMIAVVHMSEGEEYGNKNSSAVSLANACPELVAIVAAHEHKAVDGATYNNVLLVENKNLAQTIAKIDIKLTKKDGKYIVSDKTKDVTSKIIWMMDGKTKKVNYESDKDLEKKLNSYHKVALDDANQIIGELKGGNLVPEDEVKGIPTSQIQETPMINLINEVQMYYTKANVSAAAAFRSNANMKQGKIKKSDASLIYKFDNTLYLLEVTGKQLKDYMEWSTSYYNTYKPGDLTVSFNEDVRGYNYDMFSGVKYEIDISKEPGNRITNLRKMDNSLVKDTETLKLIVNNYRASSHLLNPNSGIFKDGSLPKLIEKDALDGTPIRDLIGRYIKEVKKGVITPQMNNNWKISGNNWDSAKRKEAVKLINEGKIKVPQSKDARTPNVASITEKDLENAKNNKAVKPVDKKPTTKPDSKDSKDKKVIKPADKKTVYTVKSGDCLYLIGQKYNVSYKKIAKANNIKNVNLIFVGQRLIIPAK
ncbi:5'-nucleotidase C-terminal domain-containing protein [Clostridium tetani]|uniref:5'-nucleotidase C-terminal domain-containing protein n=1 Tax=Clostridium tetani TaxID=1513 RepID=UPI0029542622|nr:5'-nucleotidase C-terminal domain-containing protein [Clostridium tetani]BDR64966.1 2',3'-cyclic-nucleotide 2'-phosphodiesterase [Clostridium tetani]